MKKFEDKISENNKNSVIPKETLQTYFKDAYMRERERFDSMFGVLEYNPPFEYPEYQKEEHQAEIKRIIESTVPKKKYKKNKKARTAFVILTLIFLASTLYFGAKFFELI